MSIRVAKPLRLLPAVFFFVFEVLSTAAHAAQVITLEDAIGIALERNVPLLQSRNAAQLSEVAVNEARMQFVPDLSLNSSGTRNYGHYYSAAAGSFINQTTDSLNLGASSGLTLFAGLHDVAALRRAKLSLQASRSDLNRAQETAIHTVVSNFLALILQQDQLQVERENLSAEATLEEQIRDYVKAGARASADLYQQQANVASARLSVIQAQNAAELSKVDLLRTLQLEPLQSYEFQAPAIEAIFSSDTTDLKELVTRALERRTDLRAEEARVESLEQGVGVASAAYWPTVSLTAGYGSSFTNALPLGLHDQLEAYRNGSVALNVSVPLFDRSVTRNAVRRARLQAQNERIALDSTRHEVELQVKTVYLNHRAARDELSAAEAQQHTAQLAVQSAQERFKAGTAILVEVSQERTLYMVAEIALVTARYNLALQSTLMKFYLGEVQIEGSDQQSRWPSNSPPPQER
ncbi:MAG TPA: TolC family protein [Steroidobacteraceae bacterium]|jgi:outer membrane protein